MTGLEELNLSFNDGITDAGLANLVGLPHLHRLILDNMKIRGDFGRVSRQLTGLEELSLMDAALSDAGMKGLQGLSRLKKLDIAGNPVTDDSLKYLKGMRELKSLNLLGTKVAGRARRTSRTFHGLKT